MITLAHGSGGREMDELIRSLGITYRGDWQSCDDDAAVLRIAGGWLVFTTDSFIVDPLFFPGGDIGDLAFNGTVNDLAVMGAKPLGISMAAVIEEGFAKKDFLRIMGSVKRLSEQTKIPLVTGDTKVMERGKVDKIILASSGVGFATELFDKKPAAGDVLLVSGSIGDHAAAVLAKRFDYEADIKSDTKPLLAAVDSVRDYVKAAKDITRGGLAAVANEMAARAGLRIVLDEEKIPIKKPVKTICSLLGVEPYSLACEGAFICAVENSNAAAAEKALKSLDANAMIIGEFVKGTRVVVKTLVGHRILGAPSGRIVPRIC